MEPLEINVLLAGLQPCISLSAGHSHRDEKFLRLKPGRQRPEHLLILLAHVDGKQARLLVHARDDLLVPLDHCRVGREVRLHGCRLHGCRLGGRWLGGRLGRGWGLCERGGRHKAKRNNDEYALFFHDKKAGQAGASQKHALRWATGNVPHAWPISSKNQPVFKPNGPRFSTAWPSAGSLPNGRVTWRQRKSRVNLTPSRQCCATSRAAKWSSSSMTPIAKTRAT